MKLKLTPIQRELLRAAIRNKVQADRALRRLRGRIVANV